MGYLDGAGFKHWQNKIISKLKGIINGTTPVAKATDADTVDGYHATNFQRYKDFGDTETDCNTVVANGMYKCRNWLNYPPSHADDQGILEVINYGHGNTEYNATIGNGSMWLRQIFYSPHDNRAWERYVSNTTVSPWTQIGIGAFLPSTGGTLTGNVTVQLGSPRILLTDTSDNGQGRVIQTGGALAFQNLNVSSNFATRRQLSLYNSNHTSYGNIAKALQLFDIVNDKVTAYPVLHTGNMADHVLPITGGKLTGTFSAREYLNVYANSSNAETYSSFIQNANGTHVRHVTDANNFDEFFIRQGKITYAKMVNGAWSETDILHTGNSNKLVVSSTPLTAAGSVRVY